MMHCNSSIMWVKESGHTRLVDEKRRISWTLSGVEETVWQLLTLGYSVPKLISFLSFLLEVSVEDAEALLSSLFESWHGSGIIENDLVGKELG